MTAFDMLDYLTANIMLPLGGLLIALFAGWRMRRSSLLEELAIPDAWLFRLWYVLLRFVAPVAVIIIFLNVVGLLKI
jgi:NSS family neurotransmitter:Na+ symporter